MEKTKLQTVREEKEISRAALSRKSGVPIRTLEDWEYCKKLPRDVYQINKAAVALGCTIYDIIDFSR